MLVHLDVIDPLVEVNLLCREDRRLVVELRVPEPRHDRRATGDEVRVVAGSIEDGKFLALYGADGRLHGALGVSNEMPFNGMIHGAASMGLADGPTEVHKVTTAREVLKGYKPADGLWPSEWLPAKKEAARAKLEAFLEHSIANS